MKDKKKGQVLMFDPRTGLLAEKLGEVVSQYGEGMKLAHVVGALECVKMNIIRGHED